MIFQSMEHWHWYRFEYPLENIQFWHKMLWSDETAVPSKAGVGPGLFRDARA